jgi:hypothetical protein
MQHDPIPEEVIQAIRRTVQYDAAGDVLGLQQLMREQVAAYRYVQHAADPELKSHAEHKHPNNFTLQKHEYDEQVMAKYLLERSGRIDEEVMERAAHNWAGDYVMQKSDYERQLYFKHYMAEAKARGAKATVEEDFPGDYETQKFYYDEYVYGEEE